MRDLILLKLKKSVLQDKQKKRRKVSKRFLSRNRERDREMLD